MSNILLHFLFSSFFLYNLPEKAGKVHEIKNESKIVINNHNTLVLACKKFEKLNHQIRDGKIEFSSALKEIQNLIPKIKTEYYRLGGKDWGKKFWVFPLQHHSYKAIGGRNGNGYISNGYNFFAGNKHGGHPAHDIFIQDSNQDCKDEKTGKYVNILSFSGGVVVATEKIWDVNSKLRGGKYIWIFDPSSNSLFYYAHCSNVLVTSGQIVIPGQIIATVGRSGLNAYKKRSPTHLHFSQLRFDSYYYPKPVDTYNELLIVKNK
jgi:murein DD-endopeptidase MepM/ murein hydrolase activator NlpD